MLPVNR